MRRGVGRRKPNGKDVAATVERMDRRHEVLALTIDGLSGRAIAGQLGISHTQVQRDLKLALGERSEETSAQSRVLAKERIEAIIAANMPAARGEFSLMKLDSGKLVLNAIALDAKINGYEAPKKLEMTGKDGGPLETRSTHDDLLSRLTRIATANGAGAGDSKPEPN